MTKRRSIGRCICRSLASRVHRGSVGDGVHTGSVVVYELVVSVCSPPSFYSRQ
jgi:hypothetical protein